MEGRLDLMPLPEVLVLIHQHRRSGFLSLQVGPLPLELTFAQGEVVEARILDWEGLEALFTFPLHPKEGTFRFQGGAVQEAPALFPFTLLLGEWARVNDEWDRFRSLVDSPSRVLEALRPEGPYGIFFGGKSVRAVAKAADIPLLVAMEQAYMGVREGYLYPLRRYAWYALRIRHKGRGKTLEDYSDLLTRLDGSRNLGELVAEGVPLGTLRRFLIQGLASGVLSPPGRGWLLRDLTWEVEAEGTPAGLS